MERTLKIFISCALGAWVGKMAASEINGHFWWLGLLMGGLVGYLSYEFKVVITAVQHVWREVVGWRPNRKLWKLTFQSLFWVMAASITFSIGCCIFLIPFGIALSRPNSLDALMLHTEIVGALVFSLFFAAFFIAWATVIGTVDQESLMQDINRFKKINPWSVYLHYLPTEARSCLKGIPHAIPVIARGLIMGLLVILRFIKAVFILIHSDVRLICGVDAAIGAAVGYFSGSAIIGAIAGGLIGALNYEVISIRVLRLVPNKNT